MFIVKHFAGCVQYSVDTGGGAAGGGNSSSSFIAKNNDVIPPELQTLTLQAAQPLPEMGAAAGGGQAELSLLSRLLAADARDDAHNACHAYTAAAQAGGARGPKTNKKKKKTSKKKRTVAARFTAQMVSLSDSLRSTRCSFVRCVKVPCSCSAAAPTLTLRALRALRQAQRHHAPLRRLLARLRRAAGEWVPLLLLEYAFACS
jgi:hypothetical protein